VEIRLKSVKIKDKQNWEVKEEYSLKENTTIVDESQNDVSFRSSNADKVLGSMIQTEI